MPASPTMPDAFSALGVAPPECDECEGRGTVTYFTGPHECTRECEGRHGVGRRLHCPHCVDGTQPETGGTCPTCDGYAALS
ncbi:hypothetical protein AB0G73_18810 [Streptomyces sp. NPDC020719]|uniref:hypothetical protein n=1 Tax=Streptomyces sp. NPDC020719 TaxID=3154896 RepID=UPI0033F0A581